MKTGKVFNVLFREKPAQMLLTLLYAAGDIYASTLAKNIDCTYSHVVKVLHEMNNADIVTFEKRGRLKILALTKKGTEIAKNIDAIRRQI